MENTRTYDLTLKMRSNNKSSINDKFYFQLFGERSFSEIVCFPINDSLGNNDLSKKERTYHFSFDNIKDCGGIFRIDFGIYSGYSDNFYISSIDVDSNGYNYHFNLRNTWIVDSTISYNADTYLAIYHDLEMSYPYSLDSIISIPAGEKLSYSRRYKIDNTITVNSIKNIADGAEIDFDYVKEHIKEQYKAYCSPVDSILVDFEIDAADYDRHYQEVWMINKETYPYTLGETNFSFSTCSSVDFIGYLEVIFDEANNKYINKNPSGRLNYITSGYTKLY